MYIYLKSLKEPKSGNLSLTAEPFLLSKAQQRHLSSPLSYVVGLGIAALYAVKHQ